MSLKELIATDKDKLAAAEQKISDLRELLRDVYDVTSRGHRLSLGLMARVRAQAAFGRQR